MNNLAARVPLQDLKIVITAILIQKESGGNLAEVLDKAAYVIRERFRLKRQVRVHTAQGRLTGWILSFLPVVLGIALYLVNPDEHEPLVDARNRRQASLSAGSHDDHRRFDYSQDRQHGRLKVSYGICSL